MSVILKVLTLIGLPLVFYGVAVLMPAQSLAGNSLETSAEDIESSEMIITAEDPLILLPPLAPPTRKDRLLVPKLLDIGLDSINTITQSMPSHGLYPLASSVLVNVRRAGWNISSANNFDKLDGFSEIVPQTVLSESSNINSTVLLEDELQVISQDLQKIYINSHLVAFNSIISAGALFNLRGESIDTDLLTKTIFPISFGYPFRIMAEADIQSRLYSLQMGGAYLDSFTWKNLSSFTESSFNYSINQFPSELTINGHMRSDFSSHIPFVISVENFLGGLTVGKTNSERIGTNIGVSFWSTPTSIDWSMFFSGKLILDRSLPDFSSEWGGRLQIYSSDSIVILPIFTLLTVVVPGLQAKMEFQPLLATPDWLKKDLSLTLLHSDQDKSINMHSVQTLAPEKGWLFSGVVSYTEKSIDNLISVVTLNLGINGGSLYRLEPSEVALSEGGALIVNLATELFFDGNMNFYSNKLLLAIGVVTDLKSKSVPRMKIESTWPVNKLSGIYLRVSGSLAAPPVYSHEISSLAPLEHLFGSTITCALSWRGESDSQIEVSSGLRMAWESNMYGFIGINYSSD